jgi:hypothetical protein
MKHLTIVLIALLAACGPGGGKTRETGTWIRLFNGKDLDDWQIKFAGHPLGENFNNTFRVEDGKLVVRYDEWDSIRGEYGHIFYRTPYSSYKIRVEYRVVGKQVAGGPSWAYKNNGIMFHCQSPETMLLDQPFPVCVEAQLLGGDSVGERSTMNVCTPGTNIVYNGELFTPHCLSSSSKTYRGDEWVSVELVVLGSDHIYHIVEGDTVLSYSKPQIGGELPDGFPLIEGTLLESGYIALQAESHPFEFRKVELMDLGGHDERP